MPLAVYTMRITHTFAYVMSRDASRASSLHNWWKMLAEHLRVHLFTSWPDTIYTRCKKLFLATSSLCICATQVSSKSWIMKNREQRSPAYFPRFAPRFHGRMEKRNRPGIRQKLYFHGWPFVNTKEADLNSSRTKERLCRETFLYSLLPGKNWVVGLAASNYS